MRRAGYNPTRRNRRIGTRAQGHGQDNRMVIPERWQAGPFWEVLGAHTELTVAVHDRALRVVVERTARGCLHASTVADVCAVLATLPAGDLAGVGMLVLRQPTRKQALLAGVWGRLLYRFTHGGYEGPAIVLESFTPGGPMRWRRGLDVEDQRELARLRDDGHAFTETKRHFATTLTLDAVRATQLYRTLPHEVGHWTQYQREVLDPLRDDPSRDRAALDDAYHRLPTRAHEDFAHGYADRWRAAQRAAGFLPFARIVDAESMARQGLAVEDFVGGPPRP